MSNFGIQNNQLFEIVRVFENYTEIQKACIYGSRAKGNFQNGSDIDLVIYGKNITYKILSEIKYKLENENDIPLMFDITHYESLQNPELKNNIDCEAKTIYKAIYSHPSKLLKTHLRGVIEGTQVKTENKLAKIAAFFHDVGKLNPNFQKKLNGEKAKEYSQHAFLSAYIFHVFYYENPDFIDELVEGRDERIVTLKALIAKHHGDLPNLNSNFINNGKEKEYNSFKKLEKFILENEQLKAFELIDEIKELVELPAIKNFSIKDNSFVESFNLDYSHFPRCKKDIVDTDNVSLEQILDKLDFFLETQFAFGLLLDADKRDASENRLIKEQKNIEQKQFIEKFLENLEIKFNQLKNSPEANKNINQIRTQMREEAVNNIKRLLQTNNRVFSLTAPTGAGKTFMMLALTAEILKKDFNLSILYALPFLSITEQVEKQCFEIFGKSFANRIDSKSENFTIQQIQEKLDAEPSEQLINELLKEKYSEDTFEKPFIITTFVQLFETLLSNKNSTCMRLPNLSNRIFLIDEIQSLPPRLYSFFARYIQAFCEKLNSYAILSTATMPNFQIPEYTEAHNIFQNQIQSLNEFPELLDYKKYFEEVEALNRYNILNIGELTLEDLTKQVLDKEESCLIILNTIGDSEALFDKLNEEELNSEIVLLNTRFIPEDRKQKIKDCKKFLENKKRVILISTQLIEAGVDISFPIVFRDLCPLSSLIQSAGRCNRNKEDEQNGLVYFFTLLDTNRKKAKAEFIYSNKDSSLLRWTKALTETEIAENQLIDKQKQYFKNISENLKVGDIGEPKETLIDYIAELRFEDMGKFRLIDEKKFGEEYKFYIPNSIEEGQSKYFEIEDELLKLTKAESFQDKKRIRIRLDKLKSEIENRTVNLRINKSKINDLPISSLKPILGIHWLSNLSCYNSAYKGLQLKEDIDERII